LYNYLSFCSSKTKKNKKKQNKKNGANEMLIQRVKRQKGKAKLKTQKATCPTNQHTKVLQSLS